MTLTFTIPWHAMCSDNRKYVALGVLSSEYRDAKMAAGLFAKVAAKKAKWVPPQGPLTLVVEIWEPDHRKRDILNHAKMLCDAVTACDAVWFDDSQIAHATFIRAGTDKANPRAHLTIAKQESGWERETPPDRSVSGATSTPTATSSLSTSASGKKPREASVKRGGATTGTGARSARKSSTSIPQTKEPK